MGLVVDLRARKAGDEAPGGAKLDLCPRCGKVGLWLNAGPSQREAYAHVIDKENWNVLESCLLDFGGST
jgi:hypothetical protein